MNTFNSNRLLEDLKHHVLSMVVLTASSIAAYIFVNNQFGGYDLSPLVDLSWRLSNGEIPGNDFINTLPLALVSAVKLISWGELAWTDLTFVNIAIVLGTYLFLSFSPKSQKVSWQWYSLIALVISLPLIYTNHLWHSSISQYLAVMYFYATYQVLKIDRGSITYYVFVFVASGMLALAKQNVALPILFASTLFFLCSPKTKKLLFVTIAGALTGLVLCSIYVGSSLESFLYSYQAVFGRGKPDFEMYRAFRSVKTHWFIALITLFCLSLFYLSSKKVSVRERLYLYMFALLSTIPILTDWDTKINNIVLPLFIVIVVVHNEKLAVNCGFKRKRSLWISLCLAYTVAMTGGYTRERMKHVGPFYQKPLSTEVSSGYFKGLRTGEHFYSLLSEIRVIKRTWADKVIYFGPRIEFAYLETKTRSPKGMPLWFHPGTSYSARDTQKVVEAFSSAKFHLLVFSKNDRTRIPSEILKIVEEFYEPIGEYSTVDAYIRKS
jgi:hypothetical protein